MKIGIDGRLWSETGVGRYIRNLVYNLAEIDKVNDYVLFLRSEDARNGKWQMANGKWKIVPVDIRWHTLAEQIKFPQILYKENLDLMHFPYFSVPVRYNKPFVITIHDLILNHFPTGKASTLPTPLYQLKRFGYNFVMSHVVKNAKKIIVPLHAVKSDVLQTYHVPEKKVVVTYEGVDERVKGKAPRVKDRTSRLTLNASPYFLYVGNAYPHKNLEMLIKAFSEVKKEIGEDAHLLLVGKDDYFYKKLREKIGKQNFSGITFRNNVNDAQLAALYRNATVMVSASVMEGFGLPALEAMSTGCPVLLSDIPSFREVCGDAAKYFDPNSIQDMKEKMIDIYNLSEIDRKILIDTALKRASQFSWQKMAKQTLKIYESSISLR